MLEQLKEIGQRLRGLRQIMELTAGEMAQKCGISVDELTAYEEGRNDFSFSFLYNAAGVLGVDVVDLMSGDSPKLSKCALVRRGEGFKIQRRAAYDYRHLAATFKGKKAEPFLVTVEPSGTEENPEQHSHEGQEFDYLLSGEMSFFFGDTVYELSAGDSVYYDSSVSHAMKARGGQKVAFLAVVMK